MWRVDVCGGRPWRRYRASTAFLEHIERGRQNELELVCLCVYENFDRVIVHRNPILRWSRTLSQAWVARRSTGAPVRQQDPMPPRPGDGMGAIGGPQIDNADRLKRDALDAAKDYRKPGRSGRR